MMPTKEEFINEHGYQAYHMAVGFAVIATHVNDKLGAKHYADLAIELMQDGYHKYEKLLPSQQANAHRQADNDFDDPPQDDGHSTDAQTIQPRLE